jgi:hypothetical protein
LNGFGTFANRPSAGQAGNTYTCSDLPFAYIDDGSAWRMTSPRVIGNQSVLSTGSWSWNNQGSATLTEPNSGGHWLLKIPKGSGDQLRYLSKTLPSAPYTITACFWPMFPYTLYHLCFLGLRDSGTSKLTTFTLQSDPATKIINWTNNTTSSAAPAAYSLQYGQVPIFLRIADDNSNGNNSNLSFGFSYDNYQFTTIYTTTRTNFLANANQVIIGGDVTINDLDAYFWVLHYLEA